MRAADGGSTHLTQEDDMIFDPDGPDGIDIQGHPNLSPEHRLERVG